MHELDKPAKSFAAVLGMYGKQLSILFMISSAVTAVGIRIALYEQERDTFKKSIEDNRLKNIKNSEEIAEISIKERLNSAADDNRSRDISSMKIAIEKLRER